VTAPPRFADGIGAFADRYEGFLLDQWGVIHDGRKALPEAVEALAELKRRNKRLVVLSNSGRRAALNRKRLTEMGLNVAMFDAVVTSGEAAWNLLRHRNLPGWRDLGNRCVLFTIGGDRAVLDDLGIEVVDEPENADFLFNTGLEIPPRTLDDYHAVLERAVVRKLPMVCSNPDRVAPSHGKLITAPGTVAAMYEQMGGRVLYVGKPHPPIYGACLDALDGLRPSEIVAVGDSVEHDVRGANGMQIDCCFVTGGIHAERFPAGATFAEREASLADLCQRFGARPQWVVPRLVW
jgi:HAD superfamily hydrolase (TIGR01459 family)